MARYLAITVCVALAHLVMSSPAPDPRPGYKHTRVKIHIPYAVKNIHHHHVEKVPVIKEVPVVKEKTIIKTIPVYKKVPVIKHVPYPVVKTIPIEKPVYLPPSSYSWSKGGEPHEITHWPAW